MNATSRRSLRHFAAGALIAAAWMSSACGRKQGAGPAVGISSGEPSRELSRESTVYVFDPLDERPVSSEAHRGKPTVLAFITTGDLNSQAQVSFLVGMSKNDGADVNYAVIALHPRKEIVLVESYRKTLGVEFPMALGDAAATHGSGPFGEIAAVPTVVILDRQGRVAWKSTGLTKREELRAHMSGL